MGEENDQNVVTTGGDKDARKQDNKSNFLNKANKAKEKVQKIKKWIKYFPIILKVLIFALIIIIITGLVFFFQSLPGTYIESAKEFGQKLWTNLVGFINGDNVTGAVSEKDQIALAQKIQDMGYDIVGYGFADATYEYDDAQNSEDIDGITNGKIISITPLSNSKNYLQAYIAQSESTYVLSTWSVLGEIKNIIQKGMGWLFGEENLPAESNAKAFSEGMINVNIEENSQNQPKVSIDRDNKLLKIKVTRNGLNNNFGNTYYYDMANWTSIYGKPLELFLSLHLGTMMPDLAYEFATQDCFNTKVNIELQEVNSTYKVIYVTSDGNEIYQSDIERLYLSTVCGLTTEQIDRFENAGLLDKAFLNIINGAERYRVDLLELEDGGTIDTTLSPDEVGTEKGVNLSKIEEELLGETYSQLHNIKVITSHEPASSYLEGGSDQTGSSSYAAGSQAGSQQNSNEENGEFEISHIEEDYDKYIRILDFSNPDDLTIIQQALNNSNLSSLSAEQLEEMGKLIINGTEEATTYLPRISSVTKHWYYNDIVYTYGTAGKAKKKVQYSTEDEENPLSENNLNGASIILDETFTNAAGVYYQLAEPTAEGPNEAIVALFKGGSGTFDGEDYDFPGEYYRYDGTRLTAQKIANAKAEEMREENPKLTHYYFQGELHRIESTDNPEWQIEKQKVTFSSTDEDGNTTNSDALTALSILENVHSVDAETVYRIFKELLVSLEYFSKEDFMKPLNQVLLWPVERVGSDTEEDDENAENVTKGIYKKENEYGLFLENGVAVNAGDSIITPGDAIVESVEGNTIKIKFKSISDGNAQVLKDKFGTDYFDVDRDIVLDMEMTITGINVAVAEGQELTAGTVIGTATSEDVRILMFNIDKSLVEDIETYMYPTYEGTHLGVFEEISASEE